MRPEGALLLAALAGCGGGGGAPLPPERAAPVDCVLRHATPQELLVLARGTVGHPQAAAVARDVRARPEAAACLAARLPPPDPPDPETPA